MRNRLMILTGLVSIALLISCEKTETDPEVIKRSYIQIATGQTSTYNADGALITLPGVGDDFYGQDGNYLKGEPMSFTDNGDSTITDNNTGLMWESIPIPTSLTYEEAIEYYENLSLAGYDDWRLPNVKELQAIVSYLYAPGATNSSEEGAAIDPIFSCTIIVNEAGVDDYGYYWTGTSANFTSDEPYYYAGI